MASGQGVAESLQPSSSFKHVVMNPARSRAQERKPQFGMKQQSGVTCSGIRATEGSMRVEVLKEVSSPVEPSLQAAMETIGVYMGIYALDTSMSLYIYICIHTCTSIHPSIHPSIRPSVHPSVHPCRQTDSQTDHIHTPIHACIHTYIHCAAHSCSITHQLSTCLCIRSTFTATGLAKGSLDRNTPHCRTQAHDCHSNSEAVGQAQLPAINVLCHNQSVSDLPPTAAIDGMSCVARLVRNYAPGTRLEQVKFRFNFVLGTACRSRAFPLYSHSAQ